MKFEFTIPRTAGELRISLQPGNVLFLLGANGTGKSSLMFRFNRTHPTQSERITAHRQNWLPSRFDPAR